MPSPAGTKRPPEVEQDDAACKVSKRKPLADVKPRQLTRRTEEIWNLVKQSATAEDVVTVLTKVLEKAEEEWPGSFKSLAQQYQKDPESVGPAS